MEPRTANRQGQLARMEEQDRVSQTSSVVTISSFPVIKKGDERVQTFGKGCRAAKRDPNYPVVIRGWLYKKDSSGLKLWKRRWFVLSNYCLFYYKDSREESALGSIPLPSYNILFCTPRECKNRKNTFKVVHRGMRSYFLSADTQEDMLGWVRALSQSACMEYDPSINRRCSSYQDFTQIGGSSESVELPHSPSLGEVLSKSAGRIQSVPKEPRHLTGGRMGAPHTEQKGRRSGQPSPTPKTPSPPDFSRRRGCGPSLEDGPHHFHSGQQTPPRPSEYMGTGSLTPRGQLGSRPHTPVGRVDIRPQEDLGMPQTLCFAPASPQLEFRSTPHTPVTERWQTLSKPTATYASLHHLPGGRRQLGKNYSTGAHTDLLPPLPPSSRAPHPPHHHHHHHHHHRSHMSVCLLPPAMPAKPDLFKERETPPLRPIESDADAVLTRLCGCDKLLQSLSVELAQLQVDKDSVQGALEMTRLQLEEWRGPVFQVQEGVLIQKTLLQEELVTIRARMCDVSLEMERVWSQYERMESELSVFRSHLQHVCNFGMPQEQSQAQRELWMMEDILAGLKVNREHFRLLLGLQSHQMYQKTPPHPGSPGSPIERGGPPTGLDQDLPARPPLPEELHCTSQSRDKGHGWLEPTYEGIYSGPVDPLHRRSDSHHDTQESQSTSRWTTPDTIKVCLLVLSSPCPCLFSNLAANTFQI
ncbi:pleckstrin homology domain-containing family A member 4 [Aplochiton taeniatus]